MARDFKPELLFLQVHRALYELAFSYRIFGFLEMVTQVIGVLTSLKISWISSFWDVNLDEDSADVGLMKMQGFSCIPSAVLAEVQGMGDHAQAAVLQFCWISWWGTMFVSDGRGGGVIWSEGAGGSRWRQDRTLLSYSVSNITAENSSTAFLFSLVELSWPHIREKKTGAL